MLATREDEVHPLRMVHVVVNPVSGAGNAPGFIKQHVLPLLEHLDIKYDLHETGAEGDGGRIGRQLAAEIAAPSKPRTVIVAGGDGTAHEVIEGIVEEGRLNGKASRTRWELVILPLGTANALFSSLFSSPDNLVDQTPSELQLFFEQSRTSQHTIHDLSSLILHLSSRSEPRHLPITFTKLVDRSSCADSSAFIPSHIVLSTALHAAILKSSEALRESHPGIERFRIAAQQNVGVFFRASVKLRPPSKGGIQQYSPTARSFTSPFTAKVDPTGDLVLDGPFTYFLSSTTTPRLESKFVISSTLQRFPPTSPSMDVTVIRPLRDPRVKKARAEAGEEAASEAWKPRTWEIVAQAYSEGEHINLVYNGESESKLLVEEFVAASEDVVVETFRCGGFVWTPTISSDEPSHTICADGSLHEIPAGGSAIVSLMEADVNGGGFWVWG